MQITSPYKRQFSSALDVRLVDRLTKVSHDQKKPKAQLFEEAVRLVLDKYGEKLDF